MPRRGILLGSLFPEDFGRYYTSNVTDKRMQRMSREEIEAEMDGVMKLSACKSIKLRYTGWVVYSEKDGLVFHAQQIAKFFKGPISIRDRTTDYKMNRHMGGLVFCNQRIATGFMGERSCHSVHYKKLETLSDPDAKAALLEGYEIVDKVPGKHMH